MKLLCILLAVFLLNVNLIYPVENQIEWRNSNALSLPDSFSITKGFPYLSDYYFLIDGKKAIPVVDTGRFDEKNLIVFL